MPLDRAQQRIDVDERVLTDSGQQVDPLGTTPRLKVPRVPR